MRGKYQGVATTYNPFKKGWKTGGGPLAVGGIYNPDDWAAALQLSLAQKHSCGYGRGRICHAVVEGNGKSMVVKINDNGPMCADAATAARAPDCRDSSGRVNPIARVIDLNEKAMRYMTDGRAGGNSGIIRNVTVTLLCNFNSHLGPLDEASRRAWANKSFGIPFTPSPSPLLGGSTLTNTPTPSGRPSIVGTPTGGGAQSSYYQPADFSNYQQGGGASPGTQPGGIQPRSYFRPAPVVVSEERLPGTKTKASASDKLLELLGTPEKATTKESPLKLVVDAGKKVQLETKKTKEKTDESVITKPKFAPQTFVSPDLSPVAHRETDPSFSSAPLFISLAETMRQILDALRARLDTPAEETVQ